jgi:hypothetical protein
VVLGSFDDSGVILKYFIAFILLITYLIGIPLCLMGGMKTLLHLYNDINELMLCVDHYSLCSSKINFNKHIFISVFVILLQTSVLVVLVCVFLYSILAFYPALRQLGFFGEKISPKESLMNFSFIFEKWVRYIFFIFLIVFIVFLCVIYLRG